MAEGRDWAAVCIAPVIRRETSSPFQVVPAHKESPGRITASFELKKFAIGAIAHLSKGGKLLPEVNALGPHGLAKLRGQVAVPEQHQALGGGGGGAEPVVEPELANLGGAAGRVRCG